MENEPQPNFEQGPEEGREESKDKGKSKKRNGHIFAWLLAKKRGESESSQSKETDETNQESIQDLSNHEGEELVVGREEQPEEVAPEALDQPERPVQSIDTSEPQYREVQPETDNQELPEGQTSEEVSPTEPEREQSESEPIESSAEQRPIENIEPQAPENPGVEGEQSLPNQTPEYGNAQPPIPPSHETGTPLGSGGSNPNFSAPRVDVSPQTIPVEEAIEREKMAAKKSAAGGLLAGAFWLHYGRDERERN